MFRNMREKALIIIPVLILLMFATSIPSLLASAEDFPYVVRMPVRIVRGVTNVALGWTEIILRPFGEHKTESVGEAISMGGANTAIRFLAGITDIVTFWVPDIQMLDLYPDWQGWPYLFHWS